MEFRREILSSNLECRRWGQEESFDSIRKGDFACLTHAEMDARENKGGSPTREGSHGRESRIASPWVASYSRHNSAESGSLRAIS